jgi:SPP1 gp7 family putative phage head morphogenesis protein
VGIAKEVPSLGDVPEGWHFYDPATGEELKAVDMMRDITKTGCAMIVLPEAIAAEVLEKGAALIAEEDVAGKGREGEPHITLKFGVRENVGETAEALAEFYPFEVTLGKTKIFAPSQNSEGAAVVYAEAIAPILSDLHTKISDAIGLRHDGADYVPHITLAYVDKDKAEKYDGLTDFESLKFTANAITIRRKEGGKWTFDLGGAQLTAKAGDDEEDEDIEEIILDILKGFQELVPAVQNELEGTYLDQAQQMAVEMGSSVQLSVLNQRALDYARARAAEMVGMKWVDDELVTNPNAVWAITDTTRDVLKDLITNAFTQGQTPAELTKSIEQTGVFSASRADMIASTEMAKATIQGSLSTAKDVGAIGKQWETSGDHDIDDECNDNEDDGTVAIDENFSSGDDGPPAHPNCNCALVYITADDPEAADLLEPEAVEAE